MPSFKPRSPSLLTFVLFHPTFANINPVLQPYSTQTALNLHILSKITQEPPALPPVEHAGAHILNTPLFARKLARAHLAPAGAPEAVALRAQVTRGAREALEEQYWDVVERTLLQRQLEAQLGGDPSVQNRIRAFVLLRHWRAGEWEDRIEVGCPYPCMNMY
jgi:nuclear pore complex protein Nup93